MASLPDAARLDGQHDVLMAGKARRIVVGFDGTDGALRALAAATQFTGYGSTITIVGVGVGVGFGRDEDGEETLGEARRRLMDQLVAANYIWRSGDPADELVLAARELDADLIVVGRHRPFESWNASVESVCASVVQHAPCDVLVVR